LLSSVVLLFLDFKKWVNENHKKAIVVCSLLGGVLCLVSMFLLGGPGTFIPFFDALKGVFGLFIFLLGIIVIRMPYEDD
jgi:cadmium resistance protein CadD (predicted permease)